MRSKLIRTAVSGAFRPIFTENHIDSGRHCIAVLSWPAMRNKQKMGGNLCCDRNKESRSSEAARIIAAMINIRGIAEQYCRRENRFVAAAGDALEGNFARQNNKNGGTVRHMGITLAMRRRGEVKPGQGVNNVAQQGRRRGPAISDGEKPLAATFDFARRPARPPSASAGRKPAGHWGQLTSHCVAAEKRAADGSIRRPKQRDLSRALWACGLHLQTMVLSSQRGIVVFFMASLSAERMR